MILIYIYIYICVCVCVFIYEPLLYLLRWISSRLYSIYSHPVSGIRRVCIVLYLVRVLIIMKHCQQADNDTFVRLSSWTCFSSRQRVTSHIQHVTLASVLNIYDADRSIAVIKRSWTHHCIITWPSPSNIVLMVISRGIGFSLLFTVCEVAGHVIVSIVICIFPLYVQDSRCPSAIYLAHTWLADWRPCFGW